MIDYIPLRKRHQKFVRDIKVIPSEEVVPQHKLLVCDLKVIKPEPVKEKFTPRLKTWKLWDPGLKEAYEAKFKESETAVPAIEVESTWTHLKNRLLNTAKEVCGFTKKHNVKRETWW